MQKRYGTSSIEFGRTSHLDVKVDWLLFKEKTQVTHLLPMSVHATAWIVRNVHIIKATA